MLLKTWPCLTKVEGRMEVSLLDHSRQADNTLYPAAKRRFQRVIWFQGVMYDLP
jgi:hypothetical protein